MEPVDLPQRQAWRGGGVKYDGVTAPRARDAPLKSGARPWAAAGDMRQRDSREINSLLSVFPDGKISERRKRGNPYGTQRCYERKTVTDGGNRMIASVTFFGYRVLENRCVTGQSIEPQ